ncbi:MAG: hypothetical protein JSW58_16110 [Candidatus Latescibacterota bacterium]|nr:MAG: hypothetical protein JSW58_16110 [Candidatus Latescibacterota bacterium]
MTELPKSRLLRQIAKPGADADKIAKRMIQNPGLLPELLDGITSDQARVKFGCSKVARIISENAPELLYPKMGFFIDLLDIDNTFLVIDAARVIANLTRADKRGRFEKVFKKYFSPIPGPTLITAANAISEAPKIARAKPKLTERIVREMLKVEKASYATKECRNIALGRAITSFDQFFDQISDKKPVVALVKKQLRNKRNSTRKKAEQFVKKWQV